MGISFASESKRAWQELLGLLKGAARRIFMASIVKSAGRGGAALAERELGWNRVTIDKGLRDLESGITRVDATSTRGRKPLEAILQNLEVDLRAMGEASCQTDPTFATTQLYRRLTASEARRRLI